MDTKTSKGHNNMPAFQSILDKSQFVYYKEAVSSLHDITLVLYLGKEAVRDSRVQKIKLS
jgi:hypothetical protein